jgi:hypothetical protein
MNSPTNPQQSKRDLGFHNGLETMREARIKVRLKMKLGFLYQVFRITSPLPQK